TEESYPALPETSSDYLIVASWPEAGELDGYIDDEAEAIIDEVCFIVSAIRSARSRYNISPKTELSAVIKASPDNEALLGEQIPLIKQLARADEITISSEAQKPPQSTAMVGSEVEVYTILAGIVDFDAELARLKKEQDKAEKDRAKLEKKLANQGFLTKAAPEIIAKDRAHLEELTGTVARLEASIKDLAQ
ncbi:MAG: valine--tRNA ligase, partial [Eggerthellaceae bacterium]|nr:valine--tRNA ligase [Eggerthellaceae bacterium]